MSEVPVFHLRDLLRLNDDMVFGMEGSFKVMQTTTLSVYSRSTV